MNITKADFMFVSNNPVMVRSAKRCREEFYTVVNALKESGITYNNDLGSYAKMDSNFSKSKLGIGWSSNLAMLALSYYWTEVSRPKEEQNEELIKDLHDNVVILAVLAQVIIDSCKREYEVDGMEEIKRIQKLPCMQMIVDDEKKDFPRFMRYTRTVAFTKNGKERPRKDIMADRQRLDKRINNNLVCPMNWLEECLDKIPTQETWDGELPSIKEYFIKDEKHDNYSSTSNKRVSKAYNIVVDYNNHYKKLCANRFDDEDAFDLLYDELLNETVSKLEKIITKDKSVMNRIIELALNIQETQNDNTRNKVQFYRYKRKILLLLYKMNSVKFLSNFKKA